MCLTLCEDHFLGKGVIEMGSWTLEQQYRLAVEENVVKSELPSFTFHDKTNCDLTRITGDFISSSNSTYYLAVRPDCGYPVSMPRLYVIHPCPLLGYNSVLMSSFGSSHLMHTLAMDWGSFTQICHTKPGYWSSSDTIAKVIAKGMLWIEAFEVFKRTGLNINSLSLSYP